MYLNLPPSHGLFTVYQISGDCDVLLKRINLGDKAAMYQLIMLYWYYIVPRSKDSSKNIPLASTEVDSITNSLITYFEDCSILLSKGILPANWKDNIKFTIDKSRYLFANKDVIPNPYFKDSEKIDILNELNNRLQKIEDELKAKMIEEQKVKRYYNKELKDESYETEFEACINCSLDAASDPIHSIIFEVYVSSSSSSSHVTYYPNIWDSITDPGTYGAADLWPKLEKPYCHSFNDLLINSRVDNKLFEISELTSSLHITIYRSHN